MKELYISPKLNLLTFAPMERLASSVDADDILGNVEADTEVTSREGDLSMDLDLF